VKPWMIWVLTIAAIWLVWRLYRWFRQARLEAPLRQAAHIADELTRRGDVGQMVATYEEGDPAGRLGAILALAGLQDEAAVDPLIRAMDDANLEVRLIAGKALAKFPDRRALRALMDKGLQDPSTLARTSVLRSLGQRGDPEAVPAIARTMKEGLAEPVLRSRELQAAAHALALLGDRRGMWVLKDAQHCEVRRVKVAAAHAQAILELQGRLERDPQDVEAARELGARYMASGEFERARAALQRAIELDPADGKARRALGAVHAELNEPGLAVQQYREAAALMPDHPDVWAALGDSLMDANRGTEARQAYERYLELAPEGNQARRLRKALRALK
jgi:tetratricopeptide (TPR) repeat protein